MDHHEVQTLNVNIEIVCGIFVCFKIYLRYGEIIQTLECQAHEWNDKEKPYRSRNISIRVPNEHGQTIRVKKKFERMNKKKLVKVLFSSENALFPIQMVMR